MYRYFVILCRLDIFDFLCGFYSDCYELIDCSDNCWMICFNNCIFFGNIEFVWCRYFNYKNFFLFNNCNFWISVGSNYLFFVK